MDEEEFQGLDLGGLKPTSIVPEDGAPIYQAAPKRVSRIEALGYAAFNEGLVGSLSNLSEDIAIGFNNKTDENFDVASMRGFMSDIDPEFYDEIQKARSEQEFMQLHSKYKDMTNKANFLDDLGIEGQLYRMVAVFTDVPLITALQKVRGVGRMASFMDKVNASYLGRAMYAGTIEGTFEAVKQHTSVEERTEMDMFTAVVAGGILGGLYNPRAFDKEVVDTIESVSTPTLEAVARGENPITSPKISEVVKSKQFNVQSYFADSPSETMRSFGMDMLNDNLGESTQAFKSIEVRDQVKAQVDSAFSQNFDPLFLEYMETVYGKSSSFLNRAFRTEAQNEFNELIGSIHWEKAHPMADRLTPEFINKIKAANSRMSEETFDIMERNGHPMFDGVSIERTGDYMPLRWNRDKMKAMLAEGKFTKKQFRKAVVDGMKRKYDGIPIEKIEKAAKSFTDTMFKKDLPVGSDGYIQQENVIQNAMQKLQDALDLTDEEVDAARALMANEAERKSKGTATATKHRTPIDLNGVFEADGVSIRLGDFVDTNAQSLWHRYGHTMGGDTALRRSGINTRQELAELRKKVQDELSNGTGIIPEDKKAYMVNFDSLTAHLMGISSKTDVDGDAWKVVRTLNNLTRSAKLGATWFAMSAELARVTHQVGIKNMVKSIPELKQITKAYKGGPTSPEYREIQMWEALGHEMNQMTSITKYESDLTSAINGSKQSFLDKLENFSEKASEATMLLGGVKTGTAHLEYMHSIGARIKMIDMARKGMDEKSYHFFEGYGFDRSTADKIANQINKFADPNSPLLNLDQWEGNLGNLWSLGVRRKTFELVQRANFGDQIGVTMLGKLTGDTMLGALALNLKSYMLIAYNKQLSKGVIDIAKGGKDRMDTLGNWGYQAVFASLGYVAKQNAMYANDPDKLEEMLTWDRIAANTFSMTTFASFMPAVLDTATQGLTGEPVFNTFTRGGAAGMPSIAPLEFAGQAAAGATGVAKFVSPWADASESDLKKALGSLPLSNVLGIKQITTELAEILAEDDD